MTYDELLKSKGQRLSYTGEFDFKSFDHVWNQSRTIELDFGNQLFEITCKLILNRKHVIINYPNGGTFESLWSCLISVLRFENLFEGIFFPYNKVFWDNTDITDKMQPYVLGIYKSGEYYSNLLPPQDNDKFLELFQKWQALQMELGFIHNLFLYACYLPGMPVDMRLPMLLQTFEALYDVAISKGVLIPKEYVENTKNIECPKCYITIQVKAGKKRTPYFKEKLSEIIDKFGSEIFSTEDIDQLLSKAVATRNRLDHADIEKNNYLSGLECSMYLRKFNLLYRKLLLSLINYHIDSNEYRKASEEINRLYS